MRHINKSPEPISLTKWKRQHLNQTYRDLNNDNSGIQVRKDIRETCISDQYHLCAYCCNRISKNDSHNEHIKCQDSFPQNSLNFDNIVASCNSIKQCGDIKKTNNLDLTPLMPECETEIKFYLNGQVKFISQRAEQAIKILGIDNKGLINKRKELINALIYTIGEQPNEIKLLEAELLQLLIENINTPDANNKLEAFAPVLVNILKDFG